MTRALALALAVAVVLGASACGGGKKAATTTTTTTAATTTTSATSVLTTLASLSSCPQLAGLESSLLQAIAGSGGSVKKEIAAIKAEAAKTPPAVRPDFETIANALGQAADALKGVDLSKATAATVSKLMSRLQSPEVSQATAHIAAWAKTHC